MPPRLPSGAKFFIRAGFSLVEVVIAIGIFAFCVVSIVYLLGTALNTSGDSEKDSSLSAILHSIDSSMRMVPAVNLGTLTTTNFYFDLFGNALTNTSASGPDVYYSGKVTRISPTATTTATGVTNTDRYFLWAADFSYPPPGFPITNRLLFGGASYDPIP
jgi:uncharacterized protein (TIGR02598 family)